MPAYSGSTGGNFTFNVAKDAREDHLDGNHWSWTEDSGVGVGNLYVRIIMGTVTTALMDDMPDETTVAGVLAVGSLAEMDGANYATKPLPAVTSAIDNTNDEAALSIAADITWTDLGEGASPCRALLVCFDPLSTPGTGDIPVAWIETGGINGIDATGQDFTVSWTSGAFAAHVDG